MGHLYLPARKSGVELRFQAGHIEELPSMSTGKGEFYRRTKICRLACYDISRYNPPWGS